jgi:hypothetical protein
MCVSQSPVSPSGMDSIDEGSFGLPPMQAPTRGKANQTSITTTPPTSLSHATCSSVAPGGAARRSTSYGAAASLFSEVLFGSGSSGRHRGCPTPGSAKVSRTQTARPALGNRQGSRAGVLGSWGCRPFGFLAISPAVVVSEERSSGSHSISTLNCEQPANPLDQLL